MGHRSDGAQLRHQGGPAVIYLEPQAVRRVATRGQCVRERPRPQVQRSRRRHDAVPHRMDRGRLLGRRLPAHRPDLPLYRRHAARPARARQRGRPRRRAPGGRHPAGRTLEGHRRHARPGRGDLPGREPVPGARRGPRRTAGRLAGGPASFQSRGRPRRYSGSAAAHARHGRRRPRRGTRRGARIDARSRDPCGADEHGQRACRHTPPAEAAGFADTAIKEAARAGAVRAAPRRPPATARDLQRGEHRRRRHGPRRRARDPRRRRPQVLSLREVGRAWSTRMSPGRSRC